MKNPVVVRFAPSPTGPLHIGGVRTALYNYLFARRHGGTFILRIEDTDQTRFVPGAEQYIVDSLRWCGIEFDAGVHMDNGDGVLYRQSDRMKAGIYREYAEQLIASGHAYYAFDTSEEMDAVRKAAESQPGGAFSYGAATRMQMSNSLSLPADQTQAHLATGNPCAIRFKMPDNEAVTFHDIVREDVTYQTSLLDDKVLLKSDGMPTYHLANVVDDRLMAVTHVIRGEEWLPSTPLHVLLYGAFGWEHPQFVHLPLLLKPIGEGKLSKRDGDQMGFPVFPTDWADPFSGEKASGFREAGYLPEALINFLALLGWNPGDIENEIMGIEQMIASFSVERVSKAGAKFNVEKLRSFNQSYLKAAPLETLLPLVKPHIVAAGYSQPDDAYIAGTIQALRERVTYVQDFVAPYFYADPTEFDPKMLAKWTNDAKAILAEAQSVLAGAATWEHTALHDAFAAFLQEKGVGMGKIMPALRCALSGVAGGPGVWEMAEVIGKEATLRRIATAIATLPTV